MFVRHILMSLASVTIFWGALGAVFDTAYAQQGGGDVGSGATPARLDIRDKIESFKCTGVVKGDLGILEIHSIDQESFKYVHDDGSGQGFERLFKVDQVSMTLSQVEIVGRAIDGKAPGLRIEIPFADDSVRVWKLHQGKEDESADEKGSTICLLKQKTR